MAAVSTSRPQIKDLLRRPSTLDETILFPGDVKINVQGAFIVDEEENTPLADCNGLLPGDGVQQDTRGIRLPNHKAIVSHVALDVSAAKRRPLND